MKQRRDSFCGDVLVDASKIDTAGRDFYEIREFKVCQILYNMSRIVFTGQSFGFHELCKDE